MVRGLPPKQVSIVLICSCAAPSWALTGLLVHPHLVTGRHRASYIPHTDQWKVEKVEKVEHALIAAGSHGAPSVGPSGGGAQRPLARPAEPLPHTRLC